LSEKYLKRLTGNTDIEDALQRLDTLTNEEGRMVTAQVLEATHTVDGKVGRVEDKVLDVDNNVAGVDDRVAGVADRVARVDDRVAGVDERVADVDNYVKAIDDKVAVVIGGAQPSLISQQNIFNSHVSRGKRDNASHTTSGRRHGSSEKLVIFFLR
jgi:archaellum component FlaC